MNILELLKQILGIDFDPVDRVVEFIPKPKQSIRQVSIRTIVTGIEVEIFNPGTTDRIIGPFVLNIAANHDSEGHFQQIFVFNRPNPESKNLEFPAELAVGGKREKGILRFV